MYQEVVNYIRSIFETNKFIPLHEPRFIGNEKKYVNDAIDSTFVSSVGEYVNRFEQMMRELTGANFAVATVNGTSALHIALRLVGVRPDTEVIAPPLSFVATANAIHYCGAEPVFLDVEKCTLGLSPGAVSDFLERRSKMGNDGSSYNRHTGKRIAACVPVHIFGHPCRIDEIVGICSQYNIPVVEDAAESMGSLYKGRHTGTFGKMGVYSFNGNKTITCGGGGAMVTDDESLAKHAKHLTTTAKVPHPYEYVHDEVGYNYRLPNLNAALACAQLEQLEKFIENKRELARKYSAFFRESGIGFIEEPEYARSNYWLNAIILDNLEARDRFLDFTNKSGVMTRPIWKLMNKLPMFQKCQTDELENAQWLEERVVNIPSSVTPSNPLEL
jgi:aminotransferase in exopolysaccharide biosynthesis